MIIPDIPLQFASALMKVTGVQIPTHMIGKPGAFYKLYLSKEAGTDIFNLQFVDLQRKAKMNTYIFKTIYLQNISPPQQYVYGTGIVRPLFPIHVNSQA